MRSTAEWWQENMLYISRLMAGHLMMGRWVGTLHYFIIIFVIHHINDWPLLLLLLSSPRARRPSCLFLIAFEIGAIVGTRLIIGSSAPCPPLLLRTYLYNNMYNIRDTQIKGTKEMSARLLTRALLSRLIRTRLRQGRTKGDFQFSVINDSLRVLITLLSQPHVKAMIHTNNIAGLLIAISIY